MFYGKEYKLIRIDSTTPGSLLCVADDKTEWALKWKGFYKNNKYKTAQQWQKVIFKTMTVRLWCINLTQLVGMEVWIKGRWEPCWYVGNIYKAKE